jgi:hypothetical protein
MKRVAAFLGVAMAISFLASGCSTFNAYNAAAGDKESESLFDTQHDSHACRPNYYDTRHCQ